MEKQLFCWIIVNGYLNQKKFSDLAVFIQRAAEKKGVNAKIVFNSDVIPFIAEGKPLLKGKYSTLPDFVLFMDKDIHLARHLEQMGIPIYNSSTAIELCDSKAKTHQALVHQGIAMPNTVFPPFTFEGIARKDFDAFRVIGKELGYPLVIKESYGSFGQQVYLIENEQQLIEKATELSHRPFILQEFIENSRGKDIRLNVVGGEVVASMKRISETDFRANVSAGGRTEAYFPTDEEKELAIKCARILGTDYAGVDLLFGSNGPLVCEVNSNTHIVSIYESTGINVADYMMDFALGAGRKGR
ncbi:RimK family alpha-L-glutamate ligase [Peribacillus saganii]|uniref:RimK family alpha-L-glutamate ligase n=1 Tax=Peribacillus saganii TaxID=2303992 RepID=A0A372LVG9_9BACI|nr:RimK family alpha-L-glutamate ligase [Peribacillus saganii]RFU71564.1 RimK family alpha-L-glutamate ligase [Peribacillus saganii]